MTSVTEPLRSPISRTDYSISLAKANIVGIPVFIMLAAAVTIPYGLAWGWVALFLAFNEFMVLQILLPSLIVGIFVHEGLHGFGWSFFGKQPFRAVTYGFNWKTITPYAHCTVPLKASAYKIGTALPGIALGIIPGVVGVFLQNGFLTMFAAFFLGAASGDFLCLWLMRFIPSEATVVDHPTRAGCMVV
jgi:hypothetical protein